MFNVLDDGGEGVDVAVDEGEAGVAGAEGGDVGEGGGEGEGAGVVEVGEDGQGVGGALGNVDNAGGLGDVLALVGVLCGKREGCW